MNLQYLREEVLPIREHEIEDGKNLSTRHPIYVVLDLVENFASGHNEYYVSSNLKSIEQEHGYVDLELDDEDRQFVLSDENLINPESVTRFYTDRVVAFFLTSQAAHEYLKYQSHNLTNGYVYVFNAGYRNYQMEKLLNDE